MPDYDPAEISLDLHYSSKYAQNSATTLEINAEISRAESRLTVQGKMKTAAPWLFMPFEIIDPVQVGTNRETILDPYITDWISNAASMIRHIDTQTEPESVPEGEATAETDAAENSPEAAPDAETAPLEVSEQE